MADVKWIKIVTDIFDDEKILLIESMPESDSIIVIWFKLLCLAGRQNNSGVFTLNGRIAYTDEMFATIFRRPLNTVRLALKTFEQYGMIEIINNTVTIPNWGKHQTLDQIEKNREYMRNYMRKRREEQRLLAEGKSDGKTGGKVNCKTNSEVNVSGADKNRLDKNKNRKDIIYDNDYENPFGDHEGSAENLKEHPTLVYASASLKSFNDGNRNELLRYMGELPDELIRYAIDETCAMGISNWKYVRKVLSSYVDEGIRTIDDAKEHERKWKERKNANVGGDKKQQDDDNPLLKAKFY